MLGARDVTTFACLSLDLVMNDNSLKHGQFWRETVAEAVIALPAKMAFNSWAYSLM
jgi:hypothetical protein